MLLTSSIHCHKLSFLWGVYPVCLYSRIVTQFRRVDRIRHHLRIVVLYVHRFTAETPWSLKYDVSTCIIHILQTCVKNGLYTGLESGLRSLHVLNTRTLFISCRQKVDSLFSFANEWFSVTFTKAINMLHICLKVGLHLDTCTLTCTRYMPTNKSWDVSIHKCSYMLYEMPVALTFLYISVHGYFIFDPINRGSKTCPVSTLTSNSHSGTNFTGVDTHFPACVLKSL